VHRDSLHLLLGHMMWLLEHHQRNEIMMSLNLDAGNPCFLRCSVNKKICLQMWGRRLGDAMAWEAC